MTTKHWTVRVTVRVPRGSGTDLASDATRRLESASRVDGVEIDRVCGLEPALAATAVGLELTIHMTGKSEAHAVESALDDAPGAEQVEHVSPAE